MKGSKVLRVAAAAAVVATLGAEAAARSAKERTVLDFACATTETFARAGLAKVVSEVMSRDTEEDGKAFGDRAVAGDVDGDGTLEFLVPLFCGTTGNCEWGVFGGMPVHEMGRIRGRVVRLEHPRGGPATIVSFASGPAAEGTLTTYAVHGDEYDRSAQTKATAAEAARRLSCDGEKVRCCK